jgi:phosphotransferase system IIB component
MADDITLTIRVRDMSRGELTRLQGQMSRLQRDFNRSSLSAHGASQNFQHMGRDITRLNAQMRRMAETGRVNRRELTQMNQDLDLVSSGLRRASRAGEITRDRFRAMSREVDLTRARLRLLGRDGTVFQRMGAHLLLFQQRVRDTHTHASGLRRVLGQMGDWGAGGMRRGVLGLGMFLAGLRRIGAMAPLTKRWIGIIIATIMLLGPAAQLIGALLVAALGGAFIALGAFALKGNATVKRAFKDMKESVASDVRDAAEPMAGRLSQGIDQVTKSISLMKPALESAFTATGPLISNFFGAFTDLASKAMPGIVRSLQSMGPAIDGFRQGMGLIGRGIGDMFDAMTRNGGAEALGQVWVTLGDEMRHLLTNIGEFINFSAKSSTATMILVGVFRALSGVLHLVEAGLSAIDTVFGGLFRTIMGSGMGIDDLATGFSGLGDSFNSSGRDAATLRSELEEVNQALQETRDARDALDDLDIPDAMKDRLKGQYDENEATLLSQRETLTQAIAAAEAEAATKTRSHAAAVDALKASIEALNAQNLNRFDAQAAMEKSFDDAVTKAKELKGKVSISDTGFLNMDTEAGRQAQEIMSAIAKSTTEYVEKLSEAKAPQADINAAWATGRDQLIGLHDNLGVSKEALAAYAAMVLATPESVTTTLKAEAADAQQKVEDLREKISTVDGKEAKSTATVEAFRAMERLSTVETKLNALDGRVATSTLHNVTINEIITKSKTFRSVHDIVGATGGLFSGSGFTKRGFAEGGRIFGPGSGTSDDIPAPWLSNGEFVVNAKRTRQYLPLLEALNRGQLKMGMGYASGGKVSSDAKNARNDLKGQMGLSTLGKVAGYRNTSFEKSIGKPQDLSSLVSALNSTISLVKKAFSGKTESRLASMVSGSGKRLIRYEQSLIKVTTALDKAKDKLDDLKQSASQLRTSVASGVISSSNVTQLATGDKKVTVNDILNEMRQNSDKASAFSSALKQLQQRGVSKTIIEQVSQAGIDGGGLETASALLRATPDQIGRINVLQSNIGTAATEAGKTAADAMYGAGIKAAEGLVKGLTSQKAGIEKAMMALAKSMEKAIKKALGIKSPSKVMQEVGHYTAEGFSVGIDKNKNVDTSWASMLNVKNTGGSPSAAAGSGGGEIVLPIYIGGKFLDEVILDSNRRTVRTRGGNVQAVFGTRTR